MSTQAPPRVVVADDSALMRQIVSSALTRSGVQIVGTAANGDEALAVCDREQPDALMLDLTMPGLDGIGVLRTLRTRGRSDMPVIVVSAFSPAHGARAVDALAEGAFDLVAKPAAGEGLDGFQAALAGKVNAAVIARNRRSAAATATRRPLAARPRPRSAIAKAVLIATSTGGPKALATLLPQLPAPLGTGTLIVQHMPPGFTRSLATRLDGASKLAVREAKGGESMDPNVALLAPGGKHMRVGDDGHVRLTEESEIGALRPRADLMISDAAKVFRDRTLLVVMTGMGNDGLIGARDVKRYGGRIFVEDQSTCTVYGMPRAVEEAKLADAVLPLGELADAIAAEVGP